MSDYRKNPDAIARLTPEQFRVTQEGATERPGTGAYLDNKAPGIYVDIVSDTICPWCYIGKRRFERALLI